MMLLTGCLGTLMGSLGISLLCLSVMFNMMDLSIYIEWEFFSGFMYSFIFLILMDWISLSFGGLVLLISGMVVIYSGDYMGSDKNLFRFLLILLLFVGSMILMIYSPNMISILLGWDGLGLVSYCLVIYYQNMKSLNSGLLTILSNRVGDVAILVSIAWLFSFGDWNFLFLSYMMKNEMLLIMGLIILASLTKSAQIPFSAWLPAAMAAPTPISALVHSSTLVTAGVYLMIRFSEILGVSSYLFYLSVGTMFMSGLGANLETDLKSIIALSTLSQLGVMMMSLSLGMVELAYFHLLMHALFKSLLFLCAGVFIHGGADKQDIRSLGGVMESTPLTSFYFMGCSFALCGFPFMSGYYSKDIILELYFMRELNAIMFLLTLLATVFTITYSFRLFSVLMMGTGQQTSGILSSLEVFMSLGPMGVLFIFAVVSGALMGWFFMPNFLINLPYYLKMMIFGFTLWYIFSLLSFMKIVNSVKSLNQGRYILSFKFYFSSFWWLASLSVSWLSWVKLGGKLAKILDQGWAEWFGPQGMYLSVSKMSHYVDSITFFNFSGLMFSYLVFLIFIFYMV
uniref:NADH-ubiquinone oxidoreductase chain 5 n=1 Tax=Mesaphorura yosii TaxID=1840514 RepID=A0A6H0EXR8_9HEXA|nr:NADH dehydrogenase subunit 5 [Mesaphorura yosii]